MDDAKLTAARRYARWFERLTPASLLTLETVATDDVRFVDPFNDVVGRAAMTGVLARMLVDLPDARFAVSDVAVGEAAYVRWRFTGGRWDFPGVSELHFAADGRVRLHIDHWDAGGGVYARLPLLGPLVRWVRRRIGAAHRPARHEYPC